MGKSKFVQQLLLEKFYDVPATDIILCIPPGNGHLLSGSGSIKLYKNCQIKWLLFYYK